VLDQPRVESGQLVLDRAKTATGTDSDAWTFFLGLYSDASSAAAAAQRLFSGILLRCGHLNLMNVALAWVPPQNRAVRVLL
jgi:hypothetical protein